MTSPWFGFVGRQEQLNALGQLLDNAVDGKGGTVLLTGEPGIGKTRLVDEFRTSAEDRPIKIMRGAAAADSAHPFQIFSKAFETESNVKLFQEQEHTSFAEIFAINKSGLLVAQATHKEEGLDADIFAGMLSAVQDFVRDSFDKSKDARAGLGKLEYGDMKILIEHGEDIFLTAVFEGSEHPEMRSRLKQTVRKIEEEVGKVLSSWSGKMDEVAPVQDLTSALAQSEFLVKRDLEGVKLDHERVRLSDLIYERLFTLTKERDILLILEDLHWADESSLFVLDYLTRNIANDKILIVCTARPGECEELEKTLTSLRYSSNFHEIVLERFSSETVSLLLDGRYHPNDFPTGFKDSLAERCEGNPLFVVEVLNQMDEEGSIGYDNEKYKLISEDYSIPSKVEDVVNSRLSSLASDALALAEYASCIGREFTGDAACSIQMTVEPRGALEKLSDAGIVRQTNGSYEFSHALFRDIVYDSINRRWVVAYHKSLGEYYEVIHEKNIDNALYDLARHFSRSNEHQKAVDYCIRAGEKAENNFAPEQSIDYYNGALEHLEQSRGIPNVQESQVEMNRRLGNLQLLIGQLDQSLLSYGNALDNEEDDRRRADIHWRIARALESKGDYQESRKACLKGLDILTDEDKLERARLLGVYGWTFERTGDYEKASIYLHESLEIAQRVDAEVEIANIHHRLGAMRLNQGKFEKALEHHEKSLSIKERFTDQAGISSTLNHIGNVYYDMGNLPKALEYYERSLTIVEKVKDKTNTAIQLNNVGLAHKEMGEFDTALDYYERSLRIGEKTGSKRNNALVLNNIGALYYDRGDLNVSLEYLLRGLEIREQIGDKHGIAMSLFNVGELYRELGKETWAIEHYERSLELCLEIGYKILSVHAHMMLADMLLDMKVLARAQEHSQRAVEISSDIGAKVEEGMSRGILAKTHREGENWDEAIGEFEKARAILEESGKKKEVARTLYEFGLLWKTLSEESKAKEYLLKANEMFEEMGIKLWEVKCREALDEL